MTREGVTILGVQYHSEVLARFMAQSHDRDIDVRWYPEDIGAIWVELNGSWYEIPAVFERFRGLSAQEWVRAAEETRAQNARNGEVNRAVVRQAIDYIQETNSAAMSRVGLIMEDWSDERMDYEEDRLFIGFKISEIEAQSPYASDRTEWGTSLSTANITSADGLFTDAQASEKKTFSRELGANQSPNHDLGDNTEADDDSSDWIIQDK